MYKKTDSKTLLEQRENKPGPRDIGRAKDYIPAKYDMPDSFHPLKARTHSLAAVKVNLPRRRSL
eukprot:UN26766